jgi:hypothetical protein
MTTVRLIATNAKGGVLDGGALARWLRQQKKIGVPIIASVTEALGPRDDPNRIKRHLRNLKNANVYSGPDGYERETATFTMGSLVKHHDHKTVKLCDAGPTEHGGQDQPRFAQVDRVSVEHLMIGFVSIHAPLATHIRDTGHWNGSDQARRWQDGQQVLANIIADLRREHFHPVISGDFNEFRSNSRDGIAYWAHKEQMRSFDTRVMWILVDNKLSVRSHESIPVAHNISDHPAFLRVDVS